MIFRPCRIALLISLLFFLSCSSREPVNVVLISVDTLRPDHLGCYGYQKKTSPTIDGIAARGTLFRKAVSTTTWTLPAHIALLTSLYDSVHGVKRGEIRLDEARTTLPELFQREGYETAAFVSGPYLHQAFGFGKGFDYYEDLTDAQFPVDSAFKGEIEDVRVLKKLKRERRLADLASHRSVTSRKVSESALKWMKKAREPFFLFLHYFDPHYDFIAPDQYVARFDSDYQGDMTGRDFRTNERIHPEMAREDYNHLLALYDGEIAFTDHHIGMFVEGLHKHSLPENTLLVLTSDHGEEFLEHGGKGHCQTLYEETLRIPLIFSLPGTIPQGEKVQNMVRIIDVSPTILDLAGLPAHPEMMGQSLLPLLSGEEKEPGQRAFSELITGKKDLFALRGEDWKLIYDRAAGQWEYYRLEEGQKEISAASTSPPDSLKKELLEAIKAFEDQARALPQKTMHRELRLSKELEKKLRDLGYITGE